jgi:hypothetical protein
MRQQRTSRELALAIGIGGFNATSVVQTMMQSPATTDPKMPPVVMLVRHLQKELFELGATDVANTGYIDTATYHALEQLLGPSWMRMSWAENVGAVVDAKATKTQLSPAMMPADDGVPVATSGVLDALPAVPGGMFTYAIGAYLLYRAMCKKGSA